MPTETEIEVEVTEEFPSGNQDVPEIDVIGDEAVIRVNRPEGFEERRVKLPKTTWG